MEAVQQRSKSKMLQQFRNSICDCQNCPLSKTRKSFVFGSGNPNAELLFIGEAPGEQEDLEGEPFIGKAGQLLTNIITAMYLNRDDVYICNIVKCRPPNNRNPELDEIKRCLPYLKKQIRIVRPKVICLLGKVAIQAMLKDTNSISSLRGTIFYLGKIPTIVTYHPAALLRNPGWKSKVWDDMKLVRSQLDGRKLI